MAATVHSGGVAAPPLALRAQGVSKAFFGTPVLRRVDLELRAGEVHCLVGENGSGKSTLVKVIAGVHHADEGEIVGPRGESFDARHMSPAAAKALGIHVVHQETPVFGALSVAENLMLGRGYPARRGRVDWKAVNAHTAKVLERFRVAAHPGQRVRDLAPAVQATIAIARALQDCESAHEGVLVLDEPTAALAEAEVEVLLEAIRGYAADGQAIVLVTHRLEEVLGVADRITVLRDGERVAVRRREGLDRRALIGLIVGDTPRIEPAPERPDAIGPCILDVEDLAVGPLEGVDLKVHAGEVVGVAGLLGAGAAELVDVLFGVRAPQGGAVRLDGEPLVRATPSTVMARGVALVPQDRPSDAAFAPLSVRENLSMGMFSSFWRRGRMARGAEIASARELADVFDVAPRRPDATMSTLSGGNQQKVVLARWLRRIPRLILLHEPTQGVDIGARGQIHDHIRAAVREGAGALLVTSDLDELLRLSDRVVVLAAGGVLADRPARDLDRQEVIDLMHSSHIDSDARTPA